DHAESRADLLVSDQQTGVIVTKSDLRRQIAQWRKLVLRVERELSAHAPVTEQKRIVPVILQSGPADLAVFGHILVGNEECKELARGVSAGFEAGFDGVGAARTRAGLMRQAGDQTGARMGAILSGEDRDVGFAAEQLRLMPAIKKCRVDDGTGRPEVLPADGKAAVAQSLALALSTLFLQQVIRRAKVRAVARHVE